jgi:hypothetical protein
VGDRYDSWICHQCEIWAGFEFVPPLRENLRIDPRNLGAPEISISRVGNMGFANRNTSVSLATSRDSRPTGLDLETTREAGYQGKPKTDLQR